MGSAARSSNNVFPQLKSSFIKTPHFSFRVFILMRTSKPCVKVFRHENFIRDENTRYKPMRDSAWEIMLSRQKMTRPYWFQIIWSVWLIAMFAACVGVNIYDIVSERNTVMTFIACGFDGISLLIWILLTSISLTLYKPASTQEVKGEFLRFSYFYTCKRYNSL